VRLHRTVVTAATLLLAACSATHPTTAAVVRATTTTAPASTTSSPPPAAPPAPTTTARPAPASPLVDLDPSITVDLRYATTDNFTGAVLPGYEANRGLLRPPAAAALAAAERGLRAGGLTLVVLDAYRPVRATQAMVAWAHRTGNDSLIGPYIASHSQHNLGEAVDVTLASVSDGQRLDMGAPFDTFNPGAHYANATGPALDNRHRLRAAMEAAGFAPYDDEWWHFSVSIPGATPLDVVIR
jgi:D-alanyl-D-alanine dipeptidase